MSEPATDCLASVLGVHFGYAGAPVLRGVDIGITAGELVFVVGPNGAGKSTLLKLLAGFLTPQRGRVRVFGADPHRAERRELARRLAFLPQSYRMSFPFTALEIVLMGRYSRSAGTFESEDDLRAAEEAMDQCAVLELAARRFDQLSGGEMRRVLLAQALCQGSELLLLDEPTSALDPRHAIALFEALRGARRTAVAVSHDLNLAARFADRVVAIAGGEVAADGPPESALSSQAVQRAFGVSLTVGLHPDGQTRYAVPR